MGIYNCDRDKLHVPCVSEAEMYLSVIDTCITGSDQGKSALDLYKRKKEKKVWKVNLLLAKHKIALISD